MGKYKTFLKVVVSIFGTIGVACQLWRVYLEGLWADQRPGHIDAASHYVIPLTSHGVSYYVSIEEYHLWSTLGTGFAIGVGIIFVTGIALLLDQLRQAK